MQKYKILAVCLLALFLVSVSGSFVKCSTNVIFDDQGSSWWSATAGSPTLSTDASGQFFGSSCLKVVATAYTGLLTAVPFGYVNLNNYDCWDIYIKGCDSGNTIGWWMSCVGGGYYRYVIDNSSAWQLIQIPFSSFTPSGSPDPTKCSQIYIELPSTGTYEIDRMWLSNSYGTSFVLTVSDPIYATMTPVVGVHSYIEGQPVDITASMLANYTFLKFSFSPVSDSTSNPVWFIMPSQNVTLTTTIIPPYVNTTPSKSTDYLPIIVLLTMIALSVIFYKMGVRVLVFLTTIFGFLFSIYALSSNDIPFFPFFQLFTALVFLIIMIWGRKLNR